MWGINISAHREPFPLVTVLRAAEVFITGWTGSGKGCCVTSNHKLLLKLLRFNATKAGNCFEVLGVGMKLKANYWEKKRIDDTWKWLSVETKRGGVSQVALKYQAGDTPCPEIQHTDCHGEGHWSTALVKFKHGTRPAGCWCDCRAARWQAL